MKHTSIVPVDPMVPDITTFSLGEAKQLAIREHELCGTAAGKMLEHACRSGLALLRIRELIPVGGFHAWLKEESIHEPTANTYMRIAHHWAIVAEARVESIDAARKVLIGLPGPHPQGATRSQPPLKKAEALRLRAEGLTIKEIAREVGVSASSVLGWVNPATLEKRRRSAERRRKAALEAARALAKEEQRRERDAIVRSSPKSISTAYAAIRRAGALLDQAIAAEPRRPELRDALAHVHRAEDAVVKALRTERAEG